MVKKLLVVVFSLLLVASCKPDTPYQDSDTSGWRILCVDGYQYLTTTIGHGGMMAPKFGKDGKPLPCDASDKWIRQ